MGMFRRLLILYFRSVVYDKTARHLGVGTGGGPGEDYKGRKSFLYGQGFVTRTKNFEKPLMIPDLSVRINQ